jgi:hypothetical protein
MGPKELVPDGMEMFLHSWVTLEIIIKRRGNFSILSWDPDNYYPDVMEIFLSYHGILGIVPTKIWE